MPDSDRWIYWIVAGEELERRLRPNVTGRMLRHALEAFENGITPTAAVADALEAAMAVHRA